MKFPKDTLTMLLDLVSNTQFDIWVIRYKVEN